MEHKIFNIILRFYMLSSIVIMAITIAGVNYLQYHWKVTMSHIEIYAGFDPIEQNELNLFYHLFMFFAAMFISYCAQYELHLKKLVLFLNLCFVIILFRYPIALTYFFIWPIKMLNSILVLLNIRITAFIKYALAIFNIIVFAYTYKVAKRKLSVEVKF